jgi:hypothetical protein
LTQADLPGLQSEVPEGGNFDEQHVTLGMPRRSPLRNCSSVPGLRRKMCSISAPLPSSADIAAVAHAQ